MIDLFLTMGLPLIDESLTRLLEHMQNPPTNFLFTYMYSIARAIGAVCAICVGGYEAWMMILGRRVMDVMKLLRIWGLAMCITFSGTICSVLRSPGFALEQTTKTMAKIENERLNQLQVEVALKQKEYLDSLRSKQAQQEEQKEAQQAATEDGIMDKIKNAVDNLGTAIQNQAKQAAVLVETKVSEWTNNVIRFIGEVIFQMMYYGMFIGQRVFMSIMALFAPIIFGLSVAPPWKNAWSQWVSKYVTLSLWGFIIYLVIYYVDYLLWCNLQADIKAYNGLLKDSNINTGSSIGAFGLQAVGTTCMYVVGCLAGAKILGMVPEVASWLIPGGMSSSAGSAAAGVAAAAGGFVGSQAASVGGSAVSTTVKVAPTVVSHTASAASGMVSGGFNGAKEGAQAGASMPGGAATRTLMATAGMIGGGVVGAVGGGFRGAFKKSDDDSSKEKEKK